MKKGVILLLLGLLMYNSVGFIINFQCALAEWRREMRGLLPQNVVEEALVCFNFNTADFDVATLEFSKDDKRYDVVKTRSAGDSILVFAYEDTEETRLNASFDALLFQNKTAENDFKHKMANVFKHLFNEYLFDNLFSLKPYPSVSRLQNRVLSFDKNGLPNLLFDILTPPPQA